MNPVVEGALHVYLFISAYALIHTITQQRHYVEWSSVRMVINTVFWPWYVFKHLR